jgi:hypothetical protein
MTLTDLATLVRRMREAQQPRGIYESEIDRRARLDAEAAVDAAVSEALDAPQIREDVK